MSRISDVLTLLGYEEAAHVRHKHDLLQAIRHFASAENDADLESQAGQEIDRLISRSALPPGTAKAGSIQPTYGQTAYWRKLGRYHIMNAYGYAACGQTSLIEHEAIDASLVPDANRCRRAGCKEAWPALEIPPLPTEHRAATVAGCLHSIGYLQRAAQCQLNSGQP